MSIAGTQGDTPFIDLDNDGVVDPGETLLTSGAFSANGASGALTLPLSEPAAAPSPDTPSAAPVAAVTRIPRSAIRFLWSERCRVPLVRP